MTNPGRARVLAWALWDCGATGLNAIVVTFVFSVYLTGSVGADLPGDTTPASWLGRAMTVAGLVVALLAPVTGIWVDAPQRRRRVLAVMTGAAVVFTAAMSLIRDDHRYLMPGLVLLACTAACNELATVPYNAMLRQLSTPNTSGRISGLGLALGYGGSVVLLLLAYVGFIAGDGDTRGLLGIPAADGQNVRAVMLLTAVWFVLFALPIFVMVPKGTDTAPSNASASSAPTASCGTRFAANGSATTTSSTTWWRARCSVTAWPGCSRSVRCWVSTSTAFHRPTSSCSASAPV